MAQGGARQGPLDGIAFNACFYSPSNWAHFLCYHIPLFIAACQKMNLSTGDVPIILPEDIPKYITDACSHLGIRWMLDDGKIEERLLTIGRFEYSDIRAFRRKRIEESGFFPLKKRKDGTRSFEGVKAFISRQGSRSLLNDAEVAELLEKHAYETFHPEKMTVADQFALFEGARQIVGVSGAGLAPILMASSKPKDSFFLELIPPGLANTFYKVIAEQQGLYWIGVRGMMKKEYIPEIYDMERSFYSKRINDPFEVCLASLELALSMAKARLSPDLVPSPR